MDAAHISKHILLLLAAGLLVAAPGQSATLQVDNSQITLTGSIQTQNVSVTSSDGSTVLNFDVTTTPIQYAETGLPAWLSATIANCGTATCPTPATLSLSLTNDLGHEGAGPFHATVTLTPKPSGTPITVTVIFFPGAGGLPGALSVSPSSSNPTSTVPFAYTSGITTVIPTQQIQVFGTTSYFVSAGTLSGGSWLLVSAGGPTGTQLQNVPGSQILTITLDSNTVAALTTALYQGFVVVTGADGTSRATIYVNLSINGGVNGAVEATPGQLTFAYSTSASPLVVPPQMIVVSTPVGGSFTAATDSPQWIILPAQPIGGIPGDLPVQVNPSGLAVGTYNGKVMITVGAITQNVAVQLVVSASPVLWPKTTNSGGTVLFTSQGSVATPTSQSVSLTASDGSSPGLSVVSFPSWLSIVLNGNTLTITPNVSGTAPAVLSDNVVIAASGVANSPVSIPVVLVANGGGAQGLLVLNPSTLSFVALAGGATPASQQLTVSASSTTSFNVSTSTNNGVQWLKVVPTFGATNQNLTVTVDPSQLSPSTSPYTGAITLNVPNTIQPQTVPVTLTVVPTTGGNVTTDTSSVSLTAQIGTQKQTATVTVSNAAGGTAPILFNVTTTSSASWLTATPAQATTQSMVTITADPSGLAANTYSGQVTITPIGGKAVTVNVTFTVQALPVISADRTSFTFTYQPGGVVPGPQTAAISGGAFTAAVTIGGNWLSVSPSSSTATTTTNLTITVKPTPEPTGLHSGQIAVTGPNNTLVITVTLNVTAPLPTITSVANGASFVQNSIAAGEVITILGTYLGPALPVTAQMDAAANLATTLGGVQVLVSGFPAPLIYVSSTQVTAVVPYEIAHSAQATVQVTYLNQGSNVINLAVGATAPAFFTLNSSGTGPGARNADFSPNGPLSPAAKGSTVIFFLTGEGPLTPAGVTGKINPINGTAAAAVLPVAVLIGNQPANWTYAGGIPGVVEGIMQLNVVIPNNVPSGTQPVLVTMGGNATQANVTVSVK
jgi:uncharacterized protein (TIGR03437 family)